MTRRSLALLVAALLVASTSALTRAQDATVPGATEPPLALYAEHGGAEVPVPLDRPTTIGGVTFTLRARPERVLEAADFAVAYPREYHFEFEDDGEQAMWTLTGADAKLMVFAPREAMDAQEFLAAHVEAMSSTFEDATVEAVTLTLEGTAVAGKRIGFELAGTRFLNDVFAVALPGGRALLLTVQDATGEGGPGTAEANALREVVSRTFRRKK